MSSLNELLGHDANDRLVVVSAQGLGQALSTNLAIYESLATGLATTGSLMVPCAWSRDAAARYANEDVGVMLTLNSEFDRYRWGPITMSPSLLDGDGGFPRTVADMWDHADISEVRRECRAQIERAQLWGFDLTHLDTHLGALAGRPEFFDAYLDLACEFRLPLVLPESADEKKIGFPAHQLARDEGILTPDHVLDLHGLPARAALEDAIADLEPGVTLLTTSPAVDAPEIRGLDPEWSRRVDDYLVLAHNPDLATVVSKSGATPLSFAAIRDAQRSLP